MCPRPTSYCPALSLQPTGSEGGDGELSTVLNPGTEEEEEEEGDEEEEEYEKDWSFTRGLLYAINRLPKRRVSGAIIRAHRRGRCDAETRSGH